MASTSNSRRLQFERCEQRLCLAVTAGLAGNGDLQIEGDSTGPIEIVAIDADSYEVKEGGALVANVDGVTGGIRIALGNSNDDVTLDLANGSVNKDVRVELGGGDNSFTVKGGTIRGGMFVQGGDGVDAIAVENDLTVHKNSTVALGTGDNVATLSGDFAGHLTVETGDGNDTVTIDGDADVAKHVKIRLAGGSNAFSVGGDVARHLFYDGGVGDDVVS